MGLVEGCNPSSTVTDEPTSCLNGKLKLKVLCRSHHGCYHLEVWRHCQLNLDNTEDKSSHTCGKGNQQPDQNLIKLPTSSANHLATSLTNRDDPKMRWVRWEQVQALFKDCLLATWVLLFEVLLLLAWAPTSTVSSWCESGDCNQSLSSASQIIAITWFVLSKYAISAKARSSYRDLVKTLTTYNHPFTTEISSLIKSLHALITLKLHTCVRHYSFGLNY